MTASFSAFADEFIKIAEEAEQQGAPAPEEKKKEEHPAWTILKGLGGVTLGSGLGYIGMHGANHAMKALGYRGIPEEAANVIGPVAGGLAAIGNNYLQRRYVNAVNKRLYPDSDYTPESVIT